MDRKREYLEVKDQCVASENRVDQLADIIEDERTKVAQFVIVTFLYLLQGEVITGMEKLQLGLQEDIVQFKLTITEANDHCRSLIIEESARLTKDIQTVNFFLINALGST